MADTLLTIVSGGVAQLMIANPPVNAIGLGLRRELWDAVGEAEANPEVQVIVICARGRSWPVGADLREFSMDPGGRWATSPRLDQLCTRIASCTKPVIAAMHGTPLGGGMELALAASCRVATRDCEMGFPELSMGAVPGAGGTQRLPRLIGAPHALRLLATAKPIGAEEALDIGLIDILAEADAETEALRLAVKAVAQGLDVLPQRAPDEGLGDPSEYLHAVALVREKPLTRMKSAQARLADCVEAALLLPLEEGLAFERAAFASFVNSVEAVGLRHAFLAERDARKIPELLQGARARPLEHVGVVGGGVLGAGIASALLDAGLRVTMLCEDTAQVAVALNRVSTTQERVLAKPSPARGPRGSQWARVLGATEVRTLASCDLVIDVQSLEEIRSTEEKERILKSIAGALAPGAILATTTNEADLDALAAALPRPDNVIGLKFFLPAHIVPLMEIVVGKATVPDAVATGFELARRMGKTAVRAGVGHGFIGDRVQTAYQLAADFMVEEGANPYRIDAVMSAHGFALGPFQRRDMIGIDQSWALRTRLLNARQPGHRFLQQGDAVFSAGRSGQACGRGYYRYSPGSRSGRQDPEVLELIAAQRSALGMETRSISDSEIRRRCLAATANEAARLLGEGIAQQPSDIDVIMILGYGFPRHLGGPMQVVDQGGLLAVRNDLRAFARNDSWFWQPAPIWDELIKYGRKFANLNGN